MSNDTPSAGAVAWMHTLHMEGGQTYERLLDWDGVDPDEPERTGFGFPGRDYSEEYTVTVQPLYTHPAPPADAGLVGWQPIETAPRDGTSILVTSVHEDGVCGQYTYGGYPLVACWLESKKYPKHAWLGQTRFLSEGYGSPTHWMPLPTPPAAYIEARKDSEHG